MAEETPKKPEKAPERKPETAARPTSVPPAKAEARELRAEGMTAIEEDAARARKEAASHVVMTDVALCGEKAGVTCRRKATGEDFKCAVRLRAGSWDGLSRAEIEAIAWDLIEISAKVERLEAQAREVG